MFVQRRELLLARLVEEPAADVVMQDGGIDRRTLDLLRGFACRSPLREGLPQREGLPYAPFVG